MTGFNNNNKFVPSAPKTFQVLELRGQQQEQPIKKSPLSPAARAKVVNKSGSNYLSENQGEYGPCTDGCNKCSITAILICKNSKRKEETLERPWDFGEGGLMPWCGEIKSGWGYWANEYEFRGIMGEDNSFAPSARARSLLVEKIYKVKKQCGHKTVSVTDGEWNWLNNKDRGDS